MTVFKPPRWWAAQSRFVYDNKTHRRMDFDSWSNLTSFLYKLSKRKLSCKQDAELITPAIFKSDTTRKNDNVIQWSGWAAVDVDDLVVEGNLEAALYDRFGEYDYVVYSTASSTCDQPKFRVVFNTGTSIMATKLRHFWYALNQELNEIGDAQTKDLARMYYVPADYIGANNFFYCNSGNSIDPGALLAKWPCDNNRDSQSFLDKLPTAFRDQVAEYRKGKLDNTSYVWSNHNDCPFINKKLLKEYKGISFTDGTGRYRMIYKLMISIAANAIEKQYPITSSQIVDIIRQIDRETANLYEKRPLDLEANNALEYAYKNIL